MRVWLCETTIYHAASQALPLLSRESLGMRLSCCCLSLLNAEPDLFAKFNTSVPPPQLAKDFEVMKSLVADKSPTTKFVAGPDVANTGEFLVRYVAC